MYSYKNKYFNKKNNHANPVLIVCIGFFFCTHVPTSIFRLNCETKAFFFNFVEKFIFTVTDKSVQLIVTVK